MKFFPTKEQKFRLIDTQEATLSRLKRRTEKSKHLTSQYTDKSFRGMINENEFKLISSVIGKGAFCVMTGEINAERGYVKVEIHKVFRILLSLFLCLPIIGMIPSFFTSPHQVSASLILITMGLPLIIRYIFIELAFVFSSKTSLNRLRDVLDIEWVND